MKIVCISASRIPSNTANSIQVMKACHALARLGNQVHLLVPGKHQTPWEELGRFYGLAEDSGSLPPFEVEWLPSQPRLKRYDFALASVRRGRALHADAVYVWPLQAAALALLAGLPVLLELHGQPEGKLGPSVFRLFLRLPGRKRILPITRALAVHLEQVYRYTFAPGELIISPNGVDLERYRDLPSPDKARRLLQLAGSFIAGYSGHLYPGRGMGTLVELARRFPNVQFLWVGGRKKDVTSWKSRLDSENINNVSLTGFVENSQLPLYQAAMDILLMPYERRIEGSSGGNSADFCSPMKMFEYMACGRAIVSSDLPVIREVLNSSNAVLCTPEDVEDWCRAFEMLLNDPHRREVLGTQARQDALNFTWQSRAQKALEDF